MDKKEYYNNTLILFNMINSVNLASREISFFRGKEEKELNPKIKSNAIRGLHIRHINDLKAIIQRFELCYGKRWTCASASEVSWDILGWTDFSEKWVDWTEARERWGKNFDKAMYCQDFILDFDCEEEIHKAFRDVYKVHEFFSEHKIPHGVNFSGGKGFHLRVFGRDIKVSYGLKIWKAKLMEKKYNKIAESLITTCSLETLDKSTLGRRQPVRIPYSLHSSGKVCYPLDLNELMSLRMYQDSFLTKLNYYADPERVIKMKLWDGKNNRGYPLYFRDVSNIKPIFEALI